MDTQQEQEQNKQKSQKQYKQILQKAFYYTFILCAILIGLFALVGRFNFDQWSNFNSKWQKDGYSIGARIHFIAGPFWLFLGPFQFDLKLRKKYPQIHKLSGRFYTLFAILSNIGAWVLIPQTKYGFIKNGLPLAIANLAALISLVIAFYKIRVKQIQQHRLWMIRNYACAYAAVSLRSLAFLYAFLSEEASYTVMTWAAYPITFIFGELWIKYFDYDKHQSYILQKNTQQEVQVSPKINNDNNNNQIKNQDEENQ